MDDQNRKVVLGLGNTLQGDEGFGVLVLRRLVTEIASPPGVEYIDGGVLGLDLLPIVETSSHLLVLDAIDAGLAPGALVELSRDDIPLFGGFKLSQHQIGFQEVLGLASFRDRLPAQVRLIGVQPADLSTHLGLSETVLARVPEVIQRTRAILTSWGINLEVDPSGECG